MNSVDWTFMEWSRESFDDVLKGAQALQYLPLIRPEEGRCKLVTTSGLCDGINDPFYMDR